MSWLMPPPPSFYHLMRAQWMLEKLISQHTLALTLSNWETWDNSWKEELNLPLWRNGRVLVLTSKNLTNSTDVFRTLSKIYDETFWWKYLKAESKKFCHRYLTSHLLQNIRNPCTSKLIFVWIVVVITGFLP